MILHNFKYEWMQLVRDRWVVSLLTIFIALCLFAGFNGRKKVDTRTEELNISIAAMQEGDAKSVALIDSLEKGIAKQVVSPWLNPQRLSFAGNRAARVAGMQPTSFALISTGQSDLYAHAVRPTLTGDAYLLGFTELSNPVQLLFGSFDLAFVCIYLLPLLVLGFSYNLLSAEKEQGSLRLTISQPISLYQWLFSKMLLRFLIMTVIVWVSIIVALLLNGVTLAEPGLAKLLFITTIYIFFWFVVALIVNAFGRSSGANAVTIISVWVVFVLIVPAVISQMANSLYPVPSRINMIHEMRVANAEAAKESDKILKGFFRDHPELAPQDTAVKNMYEYYLKFFASQDVVRKEVQPVMDDFEQKLQAQQSWAESLRFISPALLMQDAFNDLAGTSLRQYESYRKQVVAFAGEWRSYFLPRMFKNELMKGNEFAALPSFTFDYGRVSSTFFVDLLGIIAFALVGVVTSVWVYRRYAKEVLIS